MKDWILNLYHALPTPTRSVVASLRGYYLQSWRYDRNTAKYTEQALEREQWSLDRWETWQSERLGFVLHRAATRVPYYREYWAQRRRAGDGASWEYLENWPIVDKNILRSSPEAFVADDCNVRKMFHEHTSGTTGKPLNLWWSRDTVRKWYALVEARCRLWHGVSRHDRWAIMGGQLVTPVSQRQPPFWVWNQALNQLYMSSYHLAPDLLDSYVDALIRYRVKYLHGYTSSLYELAQAVIASGRRDLNMTVALTNAEPVYDYQRAAISRAFNCSLRESYGMAEIVATASECELGEMHLWPEVGRVEVLEDGRAVAVGEVGSLVCTGLLNADMPLIRYRTGDRGALSSRSESCQCGRAMPLLGQIEGREDDVLWTADGRRIGRLDPLFKDDLPIQEAQIVQVALDCIRVRYVPTPAFKPSHEHEIVQRLQARMGRMKVVFEKLDAIPREHNGKFRAVVNSLPKKTLESLSLGVH